VFSIIEKVFLLQKCDNGMGCGTELFLGELLWNIIVGMYAIISPKQAIYSFIATPLFARFCAKVTMPRLSSQPMQVLAYTPH
jgi:hypothetical protein